MDENPTSGRIDRWDIFCVSMQGVEVQPFVGTLLIDGFVILCARFFGFSFIGFSYLCNVKNYKFQ